MLKPTDVPVSEFSDLVNSICATAVLDKLVKFGKIDENIVIEVAKTSTLVMTIVVGGTPVHLSTNFYLDMGVPRRYSVATEKGKVVNITHTGEDIHVGLHQAINYCLILMDKEESEMMPTIDNTIPTSNWEPNPFDYEPWGGFKRRPPNRQRSGNCS